MKISVFVFLRLCRCEAVFILRESARICRAASRVRGGMQKILPVKTGLVQFMKLSQETIIAGHRLSEFCEYHQLKPL